MCRSEICSLARLGSPGLVLAELFPALPASTTATMAATTSTRPIAIGVQLLFSSCSRIGENGCCSESPMREILLPAGLVMSSNQAQTEVRLSALFLHRNL